MDCLNAIPLPAESSVESSTVAEWRFFRQHDETLATILCLALLGVLMGLAARRLFAEITTVGISGVDTFYYWGVANGLLHGHYASESHRLSLYAIYALALKVLGANDYAIRAVIGGLAVLNIALVYLLARGVARNGVIALAAAALYAVNPVVLLYAGTELPHITGATFVLISSLLALLATDRAADARVRASAGFLTGISVAAAVLTHEDLAFLGLGYFIAVALPLGARPAQHASPGGRRNEVALNVGAFVLGAAAAWAGLMAWVGLAPWRTFHDLFLVRSDLTAKTPVGAGGFFTAGQSRMLQNFTVDTLGSVVTTLAVVVCLTVPVAFALRRCERLRMLLTLEIPVVIYVAGFVGIARIYLGGGYQRLFVPLVGPTLVLAICGAYLLPRSLWRWAAAAAIVAWAAYVVVGDRPWYFDPPAVTAHRQLYDAVKDRVTAQRKLLLPACYAIDYSYVGPGSGVYLGGNIVPIYLLRDFVSLDTLIAANRIGYVFVPDAPLRGMWPRERVEELFRVTYGAPIDNTLLASLPGLSPEWWPPGDTRVQWTGAACAYEQQVLRRLLQERGAHVVQAVGNMGDVYELAP